MLPSIQDLIEQLLHPSILQFEHDGKRHVSRSEARSGVLKIRSEISQPKETQKEESESFDFCPWKHFPRSSRGHCFQPCCMGGGGSETRQSGVERGSSELERRKKKKLTKG